MKFEIHLLSSDESMSVTFFQIFIFSPNDSPSKIMKSVFYFIEKDLFVSQDIQTFVIFPFLFKTSRLKRTNGSGIIYV